MRLALSLALAATARAFVLNCDEVNPNNGNSPYNLRALEGGKASSKYTDTPPTRSEAKIRLNLCDGVVPEDGKGEGDQCPADSRACFQIINHKNGDNDNDEPRIVSAVNLWPGDVPERDVDVREVEKGLSIEVRTAEYVGVRQKLNIALNCAEEASGPDIVSYTDGTLSITWDHPAACGTAISPSKPGGWFSSLLWFISILFILYLVIGAVYNHQQYSARGWDLIPHRDFWRELPVLFKEFSSHIFSGRDSGRGGYSSLG